MACFLPLISQAFPFSAGLHDTQKSVTRWSHTLVRILSLATFDCSSCCRSWPPALPFPPLISVSTQHTAHSWTAAPTCLLTQDPSALTPLSSQCNLHPGHLLTSLPFVISSPNHGFLPGSAMHPKVLTQRTCNGYKPKHGRLAKKEHQYVTHPF